MNKRQRKKNIKKLVEDFNNTMMKILGIQVLHLESLQVAARYFEQLSMRFDKP